MVGDPDCPVCSARDWDVVRRRTYAAADASRVNAYVASCLRVLFEVWLPGESEVTLEARLCGRCGSVWYAPRPTEADLEAKYRFFGALPSGPVRAKAAPRVDRVRERALLRHLRPFALKAGASLLDYGGGDGRLMRPLAARGCRCYVADFGRATIEGVKRLGETVLDIAPCHAFDVIVCNHVLEHLAEPLAVVRRLREHLKPGGHLFVEVPMEIWLQAPLLPEPVTHVNFFTEDSLRYLLGRAGFGVTRCRLGRFVGPGGKSGCCVRAWATREGPPVSAPPRCAARNTRRLLSPDAGTYVKMLRAYPRHVVHYFLRRFLPR